ncbi:MAG: hypothetical protein KatS3mg110_4343 [Pirellulaceae bacterium]|nr:MAG: hypothetical protein KatS3mg110_4343 [Pirellulaceae bacterium]
MRSGVGLRAVNRPGCGFSLWSMGYRALVIAAVVVGNGGWLGAELFSPRVVSPHVADTYSVRTFSLPALRQGRNLMRFVTGDHYGLATRVVTLESDFRDLAPIRKYLVPPLPDIDPNRHTARVQGDLLLKYEAPAGKRIAWFCAGGAFRTHVGNDAPKTRNEIAWASNASPGFRPLYRSQMPPDQSHWHYNVDREVRLEEPARLIFLRFHADPAINSLRVRFHLIDDEPKLRPPVVITHIWREQGRQREHRVTLTQDSSYEVITADEPENLAVEIAVPSVRVETAGKQEHRGAQQNQQGAVQDSAKEALFDDQVQGVQAFHRAGRTFLTWQEITDGEQAERAAEAARQDWASFQKARQKVAEHVRYRIYRSASPIRSVAGLEPVAEVGPWTGWNTEYYGIDPPRGARPFRYVIEEGGGPLPPGRGLYVLAPEQETDSYYAVTVVVDGRENTKITTQNSLQEPVHEKPGAGEPVLQRTWQPESFQYLRGTTLYHFTRWEAPPNASVCGRPFDYLVGEPEIRIRPAPVGIHLHCWGGSLEGGYGWWYNAERGAMLLATNQIPYDWWTGYHERLFADPPPRSMEEWQHGVVRPYTQKRILSFLDWMQTRWEIDRRRVFAAGSSMGGSGSLMLAIRYPEQIAWAVSWVGVHVPRLSPQFKSSYEGVFGKPEWGVRFEDGTPVWDYFDDVWYLKNHPQAEVGLLIFSNGRNDSGIGWRQAVEFFRALQETRRPHVFLWGTAGHGQRTRMPGTLAERLLELDVRTDRSLPAFTHSTLDDHPGDGDPQQGTSEGQANLYLLWDDKDIVDTPARWEMTLLVHPQAPKAEARADVTPRRVQQFRPPVGGSIRWHVVSQADGGVLARGEVQADRWGLVTVPAVPILKSGTRLILERQ